MKYTFSLLLVTALFLNVSAPSFAKSQGLGQMIQEKIQNRSTPNPSVAPRQNRWLRAEGVIKRLRQGITQRYENTLKLRDRIQARITNLETSDKTRDLTAAKAELNKFDNTKYLANLNLFDAKVEEIKASSTPQKFTPELKTLTKTLQSDIKSLRQTLAQTLRLIIKSKG